MFYKVDFIINYDIILNIINVILKKIENENRKIEILIIIIVIYDNLKQIYKIKKQRINNNRELKFVILKYIIVNIEMSSEFK